ncbi:hypothetical protein B0H16DRAFT_1573975, partial [Mycena metata]
MHPIQELQITCVWGHSFNLGVISDIVATVPQIPDVLLCGIQKEEVDAVAKLIATLLRDGKDLVIITGLDTLAISRPRHGRTSSLGSRLRPFGRPHLSAMNIILFIWFIGPILLALLVVGVIDAFVLIAWLYYRLCRPPWDRTARIAADLSSMWGRRIMRLQR